MEVISRKDAKTQGLARYFTGKPCKRGHVAKRFTSCAICVECNKENTKEWRENNSQYEQTYKQENRERILLAARNNAVKWRLNNKEKHNQYSKKWAQENKSKRDEWRRKSEKKRLSSDIMYALSRRTRHRIAEAFRRQGFKKSGQTHQLVGCDWDLLKRHIENQFLDGMSWENRNKWHIDHIIPLASAKTEEDIVRLCHYTNLQPLWAQDNLKKGAKIL